MRSWLGSRWVVVPAGMVIVIAGWVSRKEEAA